MKTILTRSLNVNDSKWPHFFHCLNLRVLNKRFGHSRILKVVLMCDSIRKRFV